MNGPVLLAVLAAGCASAPPEAPRWTPVPASAFARPLDLEACLALARADEVRAADWRARRATARAEIDSARALPNPLLSLSLDDLLLQDAAGKSLASTSLSVAYPILSWWTRPRRVAAAEAEERAESEGIRAEQRDLAAEVGRDYFGLVAGARRVAILRRGVEAAREGLRLAQKEQALGTGSPLDADRAGTEVLDAEAALAGAEGENRIDGLAFAFSLGADRPVLPAVVDAEPPAEPSLASAGGEEGCPATLLDEASTHDPAFARARAEREAAEQAAGLARSLAFPSDDVQASAGPKHGPDGNGAAASLDVPVPLFDANGPGISKADVALLAAHAAEERARRDVAAAVSGAWERARAAEARRGRFASIVDARGRDSRAALRLFEAGEAEYDRVLVARRDLVAAEIEALDAWKDGAVARWELRCAIGR